MRVFVLILLCCTSLLIRVARPELVEGRASLTTNHEPRARPSTGSGRAVHQFNRLPGLRDRRLNQQTDYRVQLQTSKGPIVIEVHRDWAPRGAERFLELVTSGYYDDTRFFRVVKSQWAQFGINGDPATAKRWGARTIPDDPPKQSNVRGTVAFAFADPNGRTTQVFISLRDNSYLDAQGFAPFGRVADGMTVADALNSEYGEAAGGGIRGGKQQPLFDGGNRYLDGDFPHLDRIVHARVLP
jgi:cyclophilin family peptidyl-prolyl cis-trans isomerase